ncbi:MAG: ABC transporter permease subunit [Betaproteobacteria bacterium]|nr:ABC transporter permease subunit [Betaproteobacteria bacterium]
MLQPVVAFVGNAAIGLTGLLAIWHLLSMTLSSNPQLAAFTDMAPTAALMALGAMAADKTLAVHMGASLGRIAAGLAIAAVLGLVTGLLIGLIGRLQRITYMPFQLLRMISPLAWMPIAVIAFDTWNGAIIFIITAAAVWPIVYSVSGAVRKLNPEWLELADNLGASRLQKIRDFVLPATAQDLFSGLRLALGISWVVLVPAELLGVTSGLGYALNDARDALEYDRLAAMVLAIGIIGMILDSLAMLLVRRWSWRATS